MKPKTDLFRHLAKSPMRTSELVQLGFSRNQLGRLVAAGKLTRLARGLYVLPGEHPDEHYSLILAMRQVSQGVVCLLSALQFHGLTTQIPREVWVALEGRSHRPKVTGINVRFHRFTAAGFHQGIEEHVVSGVRLRIYGPTKTILDCFRLRSKIGLDVALEALRDGLRMRKTTLNELDSLSRKLRIHSVVQPYLELEAAS